MTTKTALCLDKQKQRGTVKKNTIKSPTFSKNSHQLAQAQASKVNRNMSIGYNRTLFIESDADSAVFRIETLKHDEQIRFSIRFTHDGPIVDVCAAAVEIGQVGRLSAKCDSFVVEAKDRIELKTEGTIIQSAKENTTLEAKSLDLKAKLGDIRLCANDDVQLLGDMILLNCDRPERKNDMFKENLVPQAKVPVSNNSIDLEILRFLLGKKCDVSD